MLGLLITRSIGASAIDAPTSNPDGHPTLAKPLSSVQPLLDSHDHLQMRSDIGLVAKLGGIPLKSVK